MSRKIVIEKGKKMRKVVTRREISLISYNYLINNYKVEKEIRSNLLVERLFRMPKYYKTKIRNHCVISRNPRWVFRKLHISRQELKKAVTTGVLTGFRKACW